MCFQLSSLLFLPSAVRSTFWLFFGTVAEMVCTRVSPCHSRPCVAWHAACVLGSSEVMTRDVPRGSCSSKPVTLFLSAYFLAQLDYQLRGLFLKRQSQEWFVYSSVARTMNRRLFFSYVPIQSSDAAHHCMPAYVTPTAAPRCGPAWIPIPEFFLLCVQKEVFHSILHITRGSRQ